MEVEPLNSAFPDQVLLSFYIFHDWLTEFKEEAKKRDLVQFSQRNGRVFVFMYPLRGEFFLRLFQDTMDKMSLREKEKNFYELVDLFRVALDKYEFLSQTKLKQLRVALKDLLQAAKKCRPFHSTKVVFLMNTFKYALRHRPASFLKCLSPVDLKFVLDSFQRRRFNGWEVQKSVLLMTDLRMKQKNSLALLDNGFPYFFEMKYFFKLCLCLLNEG